MKRMLVVGLAVAVLAALSSAAVSAHERRDVGKYQFVVGFIVEPAFEGLKNGVDLRVTDTEANQPVEGLEDSLQVEVTHVPTGVSKTLSLRTIFRDPGHYTADLIPTAPGHYRFRFFGTIQGMEVNETFDSRSGGGGFNDIEPSVDLQFPERLPEGRELESAVRGTQNSAAEARTVALEASDRASTASTLGIIGIVLGAVGAISGLGAAFVTFKKR